MRHPVETISSSRRTCERQVIQRQATGDYGNIIWINMLEHDYADRSKDRPWPRPSAASGCDWGDDNLKRAYKRGVYADGY